MQQVNDNMDDLFKKAAHHYPLNTKSSDWNQFKEQLGKELSFSGHGFSWRASFVSQVRKWSVAAMLLLMPLAIGVTKMNNEYGGIFAGDGNFNLDDDIVFSKNEGGVRHAQAAPQSRDAGALLTAANSLKRTEHIAINDWPASEFSFVLPRNIEKDENDITEYPLNEHFENIDQEQKEETASIKNDDRRNLTGSADKPATERSLKFYLGAVIAPEFTRVKNQPFTKPGVNFGILAGYQLNNRLSFEMGILLAKKYYYTDGEHIQDNSLRSDGSDITSVNAYNSITELPFTVKYNFSQKKNGGFFASAGAVSYVMHKEQYSYSYDADGQDKHGVKKINSSSNYYFSNLQLSAGYDHRIAKNSAVRIEPYYRIPLNGIGAGDLPVTSIGLNIAVTAKIK